MSVRTRAAVGGALLALAAAPAAEAAKKPASFSVTGLKVSDTTLAPGQTVRVTGKVRNAKRRKASSGRVIYSLRKSRTARSGARLDSEGVERTKAGKSRKFSQRVRISSRTTNGTYYLTVCVRRTGAKKVKCSRKRVTVAKPTTPTPPAPPADTRGVAERLRDAVTANGMLGHLRALQDIATANGGNRASGFPGYDASGEYVMSQLRAAGYNPVRQDFDFVVFSEPTAPVFERTAPSAQTYVRNTDFVTMSYSGSGDETQPLDLIPNLVVGPPASDGPGCEEEDFAGITGQIALIQRGGCPFAQKALNAQNAGAVGAVIYNNTAGALNGTLGEASQDGQGEDITIPVVGTPTSVGQALADEDASGDDVSVHLKVDALNEPRSSFNVLADTPTGSDNIVVVGSHLDSVDEGPGINDNGSGSAFNLELALQMAKQGIKPANKVRFAFWGAEESGLVGATRYVAAITDEEFSKIRANLNFDMLASPNFARFIYDGDFSNTNPPTTAPAQNPGAVEIEKLFKAYFDAAGLASAPSAFDGRSDYKPFQDNGIAAGGLFTGAEVPKTPAQRDAFGGIANVAFDPNYHAAGDDIGNLNLTGYEQMTDAAAFVTGQLATDAGMPARFQQIDPNPRRSPRMSARLGSRLQR